MEFTLTLTIRKERIRALLDAALEGGSNSWYTIVRKQEPTVWEEVDDLPTGSPGTHWHSDYPLNPDGALIIRDKLDDEHPTIRLDTEALQRGLTILAEKYPLQLVQFLNEQEDADTGDLYLQCCLFGEQIYE
jgi:hypothetical protein